MANRWGKNKNSDRLYCLGLQKSLQRMTAAMKLRHLLLGRKPRQHIKKQRHYFADKGLSSQNYVFFSSHVRMWEVDHEECWAPKNWCFWTVVLEKTLKSPLDCKEIKPINPKGNQSWIIHWKDWCWSWNSNTLASWCEDLTHLKRPWCWEDWRRKEKGITEDEMVGWHHWLNGHVFE